MFNEYASEFPYAACATSLATYLIKKQTESIKNIPDIDEKCKLNKVNIILNVISATSAAATLPYFANKLNVAYKLNEMHNSLASFEGVVGMLGALLGSIVITEGIGHAIGYSTGMHFVTMEDHHDTDPIGQTPDAS